VTAGVQFARKVRVHDVTLRDGDQMGITATNAEMLAVLAEVKARSLERKGLLDDDELRKIVDRTVKKVGV
jgi:isopropylmalate/homocitrate/citramalate synthase